MPIWLAVSLKKAGQNQADNRVDDPGGNEYSGEYTVDPKCTTDSAGLLLGMRDIGFVEIKDIWRQRGPVCQTVVEQVSGDDRK